MDTRAIGLIETVGLIGAIEAADAAIKSADVVLQGYELSRGGGLVTVKVLGDVGAVQAAVAAGAAAAARVGLVAGMLVIPRLAEGLSQIALAHTPGERVAPATIEPEPPVEPGPPEPPAKGGKRKGAG